MDRKKKPTAKQVANRKKLSSATKRAKDKYHKLPAQQQTSSRWHEMVRREMAR